MSATAILIIGVIATINVGMLVNAIPEWMRARADAKLATQAGAGGYDLDVVRLAVRGALLSVDVSDEQAQRVANLVRDELETNGAVFDGQCWRPVA